MSKVKTLRTAAVVLLLSLMSGVAAAANVWHTSTIKFIYPYAGGNRFVLGFDTDSTSCTSTFTPNKYYYVVSGQNSLTADDVKAYLAVAIAAMAQGLQVSVAFEATSTSCYVNAIKIANP